MADTHDTKPHAHVVVRYETWTCGPEDGPDGGIATFVDSLVIDPLGIPIPEQIAHLPWPPVTDEDERQWNRVLTGLVRASMNVLGMLKGVTVMDNETAEAFVERLDVAVGLDRMNAELDAGRRLN